MKLTDIHGLNEGWDANGSYWMGGTKAFLEQYKIDKADVQKAFNKVLKSKEATDLVSKYDLTYSSTTTQAKNGTLEFTLFSKDKISVTLAGNIRTLAYYPAANKYADLWGRQKQAEIPEGLEGVDLLVANYLANIKMIDDYLGKKVARLGKAAVAADVFEDAVSKFLKTKITERYISDLLSGKSRLTYISLATSPHKLPISENIKTKNKTALNFSDPNNVLNAGFSRDGKKLVAEGAQICIYNTNGNFTSTKSFVEIMREISSQITTAASVIINDVDDDGIIKALPAHITNNLQLGSKVKSFSKIHETLKSCSTIFISSFGEGPILGFLKIKGLKRIHVNSGSLKRNPSEKDMKLSSIINTYLPVGDMLACIDDLIDAGFEEYAKL